MKRISLLSFILICLLSSCKEEKAKLETAIQTTWAVDSIEQLDSGKRLQLGLNLLSFDNNKTCKLPALIGEKRSLARWKLEKEGKDYTLNIGGCASAIFNGNYRFKYEQLNGINRMTLTSSKVRMICTSMQ